MLKRVETLLIYFNNHPWEDAVDNALMLEGMLREEDG
jgi:uncharacterized protein YecE (DUF72 family)